MFFRLLPHPINEFLDIFLIGEGVSPGCLVLIGEEPEEAWLAVGPDHSPPLASGFGPAYPLVVGGLTNDNYNEVNG